MLPSILIADSLLQNSLTSGNATMCAVQSGVSVWLKNKSDKLRNDHKRYYVDNFMFASTNFFMFSRTESRNESNSEKQN